MTVTLKPDLEEEIAARAKVEGLTTGEFVNRELEKWVAAQPRQEELNFALTATPEEWKTAFLQWVSTERPAHPTLSDEAISRESIYREREDAQL